MIIRDSFAGETGLVQNFRSSLGAIEPEPPTMVHLADGSEYTIEAGAPGTFRWVRQANLIAEAYRQMGQADRTTQWDREYQRRLSLWTFWGGVEDKAMIAAQAIKDFLLAPLRILQDIGGAVIEVGRTTLGTVNWVPWLVVGALIVVGIGFQRRSLRISR